MEGVSPTVWKEIAHTGRPHARINNSVFKKSNVMSFHRNNQKNLKIEQE